jgi:hypothetical protein
VHRKKALLTIAVFVVTAIVASLVAYVNLNPEITYKDEKIIERSFNNNQEEQALIAAESMNYSALSLERFDGSSDTEAYLHPGTYLAYTSANFIDSKVINYYETRYDNLQGKEGPKYPKGIELTYEANVTKFSDFRIFNSPAPQGATWHNSTIVMSAPDGSVTSNSHHMQIFYNNRSDYQMTEWEYDFNFSNCYVVEMNMVYSEYYAQLAAFRTNVDQIVVLDVDFTPVLIGLASGTAVA